MWFESFPEAQPRALTLKFVFRSGGARWIRWFRMRRGGGGFLLTRGSGSRGPLRACLALGILWNPSRRGDSRIIGPGVRRIIFLVRRLVVGGGIRLRCRVLRCSLGAAALSGRALGSSLRLIGSRRRHNGLSEPRHRRDD